MAFALMPLFCLGGIASPALQAVMSAAVPETHQGRLQGLMASAAGLVTVVGPVLISISYFASRAMFPGLVWCVGAGLYALCLLALSMGRYKLRKEIGGFSA